MTTPTTPAKKVATTPKLVQGRIKGAEYARNIHRATPEASTELKDVLSPAYWSHVAAKFALHDIIEVIPDGGAWYAQLLIVGCSKQHAKVVVLLAQKLNQGDKKQEDPKKDSTPTQPAFVVEFKGPQRKWSIIRSADKEYIKEGFDNKEAAAAWLAENEADLLALV